MHPWHSLLHQPASTAIAEAVARWELTDCEDEGEVGGVGSDPVLFSVCATLLCSGIAPFIKRALNPRVHPVVDGVDEPSALNWATKGSFYRNWADSGSPRSHYCHYYYY